MENTNVNKMLKDETMTAAVKRQEIAGLKRVQEGLKEKIATIVDKDAYEIIEKNSEFIKSTDQLMSLSPNEIRTCFIDPENGEVIDVRMKDMDDAQYLEYQYDLLKLFALENEMETNTEVAEKEYKEIIAELDDYNRSFLEDYESTEKIIRARLNETIEQSDDSEKIKKAQEMLDCLDIPLGIQKIKEDIVKRNPDNVIKDYKSLERHRSIFIKYRRVAEEQLSITSNIAKYSGLEEKFLEEKYHKYPNLFVFIIQRAASYYRNPSPTKEGTFLSQLVMKIQLLLRDPNHEESQALLNAMRDILDVFVD